MTTSDGSGSGHEARGAADPRPAAVSVITTEHFTLQGARSSTIAESTGRASMFLSAISGGLVALGLIATATHVGTAFYVLGLILLPTLAFALRGYYFEVTPEIAPYLMSVPQAERLHMQGLRQELWQGFLTVSGMVSVVTAVLAGSTVGLLAVLLSGHSLVAAVCCGVVVGIVVLAAMVRYQRLAWNRALAEPLIIGDPAGPQ